MRELFLEDDEIILILNLLPSSVVLENLDPTFYHTLSYEGDRKMQAVADDLREKLKDQI